jgi:RimJ/RimL family protein N-acetyltransferase
VSFTFQGELVRLRSFESADAPAWMEILNHPDLSGRRYLPWQYPAAAPLSERQVAALIDECQSYQHGLRLAVIRLPMQVLVGHLSLDWGWDPHAPDLSLVITPEHQRQGLGSQVLQLALRYLFLETPAYNVGADWVADWNQPAWNFLQKHGFTPCGVVRFAGQHNGQPYRALAADLLRSEWLDGQADLIKESQRAN